MHLFFQKRPDLMASIYEQKFSIHAANVRLNLDQVIEKTFTAT